MLVEKIEPPSRHRPRHHLDEYPAAAGGAGAAEAGRPRVAERFELYACGVELANGFGELTDAAEQRRRLRAEMAEKERIYGERYPLDEDFLAALATMPPACGIALGFDRLVMLATGAARIEQVIWTPVGDEARERTDEARPASRRCAPSTNFAITALVAALTRSPDAGRGRRALRGRAHAGAWPA